MPQMSPMNWCFLFFFILFTVVLIMTLIYFSFMVIPKTNSTNNSNDLYDWLW